MNDPRVHELQQKLVEEAGWMGGLEVEKHRALSTDHWGIGVSVNHGTQLLSE